MWPDGHWTVSELQSRTRWSGKDKGILQLNNSTQRCFLSLFICQDDWGVDPCAILKRCMDAASRFPCTLAPVPLAPGLTVTGRGCSELMTSLWGLWIFQHRSVIKRQSPLILIKSLFYFSFISFPPNKCIFFLVQRCFWYRNVQNAFNNKILMQILWKKPFGKRQYWSFSTLFVYCGFFLFVFFRSTYN